MPYMTYFNLKQISGWSCNDHAVFTVMCVFCKKYIIKQGWKGQI